MFTNTKNKELQNIYDELFGYLILISRAPLIEVATDALEDYKK